MILCLLLLVSKLLFLPLLLIDNEIMQSDIDLQILKTGSQKCNKSNKKWKHFYGAT